jgi:SNF2 family DNA or RNA helicase
MTNTPFELYPYQRAGANFLSLAGSALMADDCGLGKTAQTITALERTSAYPAMIVCPSSVKAVWAREFGVWAPGRSVSVAGSGSKEAEAAINDVASVASDVAVIGWEALKSVSKLAAFGSLRLETCSNCDPTSRKRPAQCHRENKVANLIHWAAVVADEAHRAKDPKSQQTRALWAVGDNSDRRIALTGTPIQDSLEDLWSIMRFVDPQTFTSKWPFLDRYAVSVPNHYSGGVQIVGVNEESRAELNQFFLPRFIRRTKAQVLRDLPPKVYERRDVVLGAKQRKAYKQLETEMLAQITGGTMVADNVLVASLRLRQLASSYGEVTSSVNWKTDDPDAMMDSVDQQVTLTEPSSKLDELEATLAELGPERKVAIYAESEQLIRLAAARLPEGSFGMITGAIPVPDRNKAVEDFQAGRLRYMLFNSAGGEGITLTASDTMIFLQRPWSAIKNRQAEDRLHRIGQAGQSVTYIDLVAVDTVEERVFEALERKSRALQDVVQDKEPADASV